MTAPPSTVSVCCTALLIQACGGGAAAQSAGEAPDPIVGLWDADITIIDCTTGASKFTFKGHTLMNAGGTMANAGDAFGMDEERGWHLSRAIRVRGA